jgi:hypothetical protein
MYYSSSIFLQIIPVLDPFQTAQFSLDLSNDFVSPKGIETIEKHAKGKDDVLEMPGETRLTLGSVSVFIDGQENGIPHVWTDDNAKCKKRQRKETHVGRQGRFGNMFGIHKAQMDGGYLQIIYVYIYIYW